MLKLPVLRCSALLLTSWMRVSTACRRVQSQSLGWKGISEMQQGGRRGRGGGGQDREVLVSKALSKLLRHKALDAGMILDAEGFIRLDLVLEYPPIASLKTSLEEIKSIVSTNAKQRFALRCRDDASPGSELPADYLIRANQGHSIAVASETLLKPITLELGNVPRVAVHGTYFAFWDDILRTGGLKVMGRRHVHFGTGVPAGVQHVADLCTGAPEVTTGQREEPAQRGEMEASSTPSVGGALPISGMRGDAELLIFVDVDKALRQCPEVKWWMSENGVVLTEGDAQGLVRTELWKRVVGRREKDAVGVLFEDGKEVSRLAEELRQRKAPMGKGRGGGRGRGGRGGRRGGGRGGRGGREEREGDVVTEIP